MTVELEQTLDILAELGRRKEHQLLVGFAAETQQLCANAKEKLRIKNLDLLVVNDVSKEGAGFEVNTNIVTLLFADGRVLEWPLLSKREVANRICDQLHAMLTEKRGGPAII